MLLLNDPSLVDLISDPAIRELVEQRFSEVCTGEPYDYETHGHMIVVEPVDSVHALERRAVVSSCVSPSIIVKLVF